VPSPIDPHGHEVARALVRLQSDPNLSGETTIRTLHWAGSKKPPDDPGGTEWLMELLRWIGGAFRWLAQSGRLLILACVVILAAMLAIYIYRLVRDSRRQSHDATAAAPSHVRDLDIRPESLPDDIGSAARSLWEEQNHRAALALLYRGLLSRLVHLHGVAIRESSTEGDCLALLANRGRSEVFDYSSRLVRVWQRAVYGGQEPDDAAVMELCATFAAVLDARPPLQLEAHSA
jgi:hypothetical protein